MVKLLTNSSHTNTKYQLTLRYCHCNLWQWFTFNIHHDNPVLIENCKIYIESLLKIYQTKYFNVTLLWIGVEAASAVLIECLLMICSSCCYIFWVLKWNLDQVLESQHLQRWYTFLYQCQMKRNHILKSSENIFSKLEYFYYNTDKF